MCDVARSGRNVSRVALASILLVMGNGLADAASSVTGDNTLRVPTRVTSTRVTSTTGTRRQTSYLVTGGVQQRNNLYHSFSNFRLEAGDSAILATNLRPDGSVPVQNVIARVTGGRPSLVNGQVAFTTNQNATPSRVDFYFINPSGATLGPLGTVATAGEMFINTPLPRGARFSTTITSSNSRSSATLTVADPASFGFTSRNARTPSATGTSSRASTGSAASSNTNTTRAGACGTLAAGQVGICGTIDANYITDSAYGAARSVSGKTFNLSGMGTIVISEAEFTEPLTIIGDSFLLSRTIRMPSGGNFNIHSSGTIVINNAKIDSNKPVAGTNLFLFRSGTSIISNNSEFISGGTPIKFESARIISSKDSTFLIDLNGIPNPSGPEFSLGDSRNLLAVALDWKSYFKVVENSLPANNNPGDEPSIVSALAILGPRSHFINPFGGFTLSGDSFNVEAVLAPRAFLFFDRANLSRPCSGRNGSARASIANGGRGALPLGPERALLASHLDYLKDIPAPLGTSLDSASTQHYQDPGYWRMSAECDAAL